MLNCVQFTRLLSDNLFPLLWTPMPNGHAFDTVHTINGHPQRAVELCYSTQIGPLGFRSSGSLNEMINKPSFQQAKEKVQIGLKDSRISNGNVVFPFCCNLQPYTTLRSVQLFHCILLVSNGPVEASLSSVWNTNYMPPTRSTQPQGNAQTQSLDRIWSRKTSTQLPKSKTWESNLAGCFLDSEDST